MGCPEDHLADSWCLAVPEASCSDGGPPNSLQLLFQDPPFPSRLAKAAGNHGKEMSVEQPWEAQEKG